MLANWTMAYFVFKFETLQLQPLECMFAASLAVGYCKNPLSLDYINYIAHTQIGLILYLVVVYPATFFNCSSIRYPHECHHFILSSFTADLQTIPTHITHYNNQKWFNLPLFHGRIYGNYLTLHTGMYEYRYCVCVVCVKVCITFCFLSIVWL